MIARCADLSAGGPWCGAAQSPVPQGPPADPDRHRPSRTPAQGHGTCRQGSAVVTLPDQRWKRCDIKSVSLLANILARQQAVGRGCREVWLYDGTGIVTEGRSSNAYIVNATGQLVTHPLGPQILGGVTRSVVLELAREEGIEVVERPFTVAEARTAREAFLTSTSSLVLPVTAIDGRPVANGMPGLVATRLLELYRNHLMQNCMTLGSTFGCNACESTERSLAVSWPRRYRH